VRLWPHKLKAVDTGFGEMGQDRPDFSKGMYNVRQSLLLSFRLVVRADIFKGTDPFRKFEDKNFAFEMAKFLSLLSLGSVSPTSLKIYR
jgi:hypothetical protein